MTKRVLSEAERIDWLRLARTPNVGPVTFAQLLARFGTPAAALKALPDLASRAGRSRPLKPPAPADIEAELAATRDYGASVIAACEPDYPKLLAGLDPPPPVLTVLGQVALLVEAAERSGSLISARTAGEQGREVMAVPGSPLDPRAAGTNHLIQQGAAVVRSGEDVIEILSGIGLSRFEAGPPSVFNTPPDTGPPPADQIARVREALSPNPMPLDEIARAADIGAGRCAAILMELELAGIAITLPGGLAALAP